MTLQAEDEIAAANMALGASFAGQLGRDRHERPGHGPEGRDARARRDHGAADDHRRRPARRTVHRACRPRPSRATCCSRCSAATASRRCRSWRPRRRRTASTTAIEAARIAVTYRTPVILLSDTFLSNSSEPWKIPDVDDAARRSSRGSRPRRTTATGSCRTCATRSSRARGPRPGTPGLVHRIGGLEREDGPATSATTPLNHERMTHLRAAKVAGIAERHPAARRSTTPTATPSCWSWGGARRSARSGRPPGACGPTGARWPRRTCGT